MDQQQYLQSVMESRSVMINILSILAEQERIIAHMQGLHSNTTRNSSNDWLHEFLRQIIQMPTTRMPATRMPSTQVPANRPPTQLEIESATRVRTYGEIENPINTECPISHETFENNDEVTEIRHCGHIFHTNSIQQWFLTGHQCPVCRHDIRNQNATTQTQDSVQFEYVFTYPPR